MGALQWQFPQSQLDASSMADFLKSLEVNYPNHVTRFCQNGLWNGETFSQPDPNAVENDDPSETICSGKIVPVLSQYFTLVEDIPLGGSFFQWIFHNVYNSLQNETGKEIVQSMLDTEMQAITDGKIASDYVFQVWESQG